MKLSILQKMLVVMLIISVVPLITPGSCASSDARALGLSAANDATWMGKYALADSTKALEELGVRMIEQKAVDVAGQCAISIPAHPEMSLADLQASPEFQAIAGSAPSERPATPVSTSRAAGSCACTTTRISPVWRCRRCRRRCRSSGSSSPSP